MLSREEHEAAELRGQRCKVRIGLLFGKHLVGAIHDVQAVLEAPSVPHHLRESGGHSCRRVRCAGAFEERDRLLVVGSALVRAGAGACHQARMLVQISLLERIIREFHCAFVCVLRLFVGGQ